MDTQAFTITGAVLLAVGLFSMATLFLTVCLCCICIRRVLRRNNGQGLSYTQNAAYTIAQMCVPAICPCLPLHVGSCMVCVHASMPPCKEGTLCMGLQVQAAARTC